MSKRGIIKQGKKRVYYYKYSIYSLFATPLIFVLVLLPTAPAFASEDIVESVDVSETIETIESESDPEVPVAEEEVVEVVEESLLEEWDGEMLEEETVPDEEVPLEEITYEIVDDFEEPIEPAVNEDAIVNEDDDTSLPEEDQEVPEQEPVDEITDTATTTDEESNTDEEEESTATMTDETTPAEVPDEEGKLDEEHSITTDDLVEEPKGNEEEGNEEEVVDDPVVDTEDIEKVLDGDETVIESEVVTSVVFNDENKYLFSKDQCVSMGDGSFYCMEVDTSEEPLVADGVYTSLDKDGDKEIFIKVEGDSVQITDNTVDDDAPFYDESTNTIVWHSLIDGRYQILSFDLDTEKIKQLTDERYNNMQPSRYGDVIVWQGWIGNDWEIMLENDGELEMITDNTHHDISPRINGNHIIWQAFEDDLWRVKVYDILTGVIETISDSDGGSVENPRFVLVYDTKFDNGDVETKGYDIESGELVPLSATPTQLPPELPDAEPTDEERALVAPSVQIKGKSATSTDTDIDPLSTDDGLTTLDDDIIVTSFTDDLATSTDIENSIEELIITPYVEEIDETVSSTTKSIIESIEDVVIEPLLEENTSSAIETELAT